MKKVSETWIYYFDPKTKQQSVTWKRASSPTPKKFKVSNSSGKVTALVFWDAEGITMVEYLEKGATITGSHYADHIRKLQEAIKKKQKRQTASSCCFTKTTYPLTKPQLR
ncbi:unnamed protein product [Euphydryas editha]|uniref:Transposase n=1 Tax=Euphydryas editha TaxID=104508 RepID=A0AAU9TH82_EUPED|nr:unnamed protein product [Euphydryas editha]